MDDALKLDASILKLLKVAQDIDLAVEALARKLEGSNICLRCSLERINYDIFENQISGVDSNFDYYEIKPDKLVRRIGLLESNLNALFNKGIAFDAKGY